MTAGVSVCVLHVRQHVPSAPSTNNKQKAAPRRPPTPRPRIKAKEIENRPIKVRPDDVITKKAKEIENRPIKVRPDDVIMVKVKEIENRPIKVRPDDVITEWWGTLLREPIGSREKRVGPHIRLRLPRNGSLL